MTQKVLIFILFLSLTLTYNFISYSQDSKKVKNIKSCSDIKKILLERKGLLSSSIDARKQLMSNIYASFNSSSEFKNLSIKNKEEIDKFYEETDVLILEREDLVFKIDNLLFLDCESDKRGFLIKLNIFNNNFKNHLRKEQSLRKDFEENIYLSLKNGDKNESSK